jgi:L-ascorbate metabolism protein UlaG (beta-lactamase superfamily)
MEIEYKGANQVVINDKKIHIIVDPTTDTSEKNSKNTNVVILATNENFSPKQSDQQSFVIDLPGEYERNDISIKGIPVHAHTDESGLNATMYRIEIDGIRLAIVGHTDAPLSDDDLENIGVIDIAIIPVGGGGYTLDARDAATIARQLSPKIVIPTHFADHSFEYPVPQEDVSHFIKEMGGIHQKLPSLKIKGAGSLPEALTVFELIRTT